MYYTISIDDEQRKWILEALGNVEHDTLEKQLLVKGLTELPEDQAEMENITERRPIIHGLCL